MSQIITPTVGRKVWYRPSAHDVVGPVPMSVAGPADDPSKGQPLDATVIAVWGDRMVNLLVTDSVGRQFPVLSCPLLQEGDESPAAGRYAEWMPYQQGQARRDAASAPAAATDVTDYTQPADGSHWTVLVDGDPATLPAPGEWLVTVDTEDGREVHVLVHVGDGKWVHDGEYTFQHSYQFRPIAWAPPPEAYTGEACQ